MDHCKILELVRDEYIGVDCYERGEDRNDYRNGYKPTSLYTGVGPLVLRVRWDSDHVVTLNDDPMLIAQEIVRSAFLWKGVLSKCLVCF